MSKLNRPTDPPEYPFPRVDTQPGQGLTEEEATLRRAHGACNTAPQGPTPSVGKILLQNIITPFNIINLLLALAVVLVGQPRNALFFLVAVCNTFMGIFQELRAKRTLDKLSILAKGSVTAVRGGRQQDIPQEEVVLDDILLLSAGRQVCADAVVVSSDGLELDESLLTGESDNIQKHPGDTVLSGSFVAAGRGAVRVSAVGGQSYAGRLTLQAKKEKKRNAPLLRTLNNIIRVLALVIIPIGLLLFFNQYTGPENRTEAVLGSTAAMVGMIPEGLVLLTGVTLTLGALKLARRKALVQALPSIETLARADILCLDKTGTITDGTLSFEKVLPLDGENAETAKQALAEMMAALRDENATAAALRGAFPNGGDWTALHSIPFSSKRKWSAACFEGHGSYVLGAPGFVFPGQDPSWNATVREYAARGMRVLCLAHSAAPLAGHTLPEGLTAVALVVLSDTVRPEAPETFRFFASEGLTLKVISGDDALTVSTIAEKAGIEGAGRCIDMSQLPTGADYAAIATQNTVFGRVSPEQKKQLVAALKAAGHTVAMTGDGVNDVPALKESDCGFAMISGSEAARGAADFVLMTSDFSAMVDVFKEGRRVINNIENVASLYLVKTIYSVLLSFFYVFIPYPYPFAPLQMTPINALTVGIPSFFLALRPDYDKPRGRFLPNVLENSLPAALSVVFNILVVQLAGYFFGLSQLETSTMNVLLTGAVGFRLLVRVTGRATRRETAMLVLLGASFLLVFILFGDFFGLGSLFTRNAFFYVPLLYIGPRIFCVLSDLIHKIASRRRPKRVE